MQSARSCEAPVPFAVAPANWSDVILSFISVLVRSSRAVVRCVSKFSARAGVSICNSARDSEYFRPKEENRSFESDKREEFLPEVPRILRVERKFFFSSRNQVLLVFVQSVLALKPRREVNENNKIFLVSSDPPTHAERGTTAVRWRLLSRSKQSVDYETTTTITETKSALILLPG